MISVNIEEIKQLVYEVNNNKEIDGPLPDDVSSIIDEIRGNYND